MKNIKTKTQVNDREITIKIYADGEEADKIVRYHNYCMICKEETVDDKDFGEEYICPHCVKWLTNKLGVKKTVNKQSNETTKKAPTKKTRYRLHRQIKEYNPSIKIYDIEKFNKKITWHSIYCETLTALVDLVLKGENTANKIKNTLTGFKVETIYKYLMAMVDAGMLSTVEIHRKKDLIYDRMFRVHQSLLDGNIERV